MENSQEDPGNNKPLWEWNLEDVLRWLLVEFNFEEEILKNFVFHEIDGLDLIDLTEDNLKYDLKIFKINLRKRIMRRIVDLLRLSISQNSVNSVMTSKKSNSFNRIENRVSEDKDNILFQSFSFKKNENSKNIKTNSSLKSQIPRTIGNPNNSKKTKINIALHYLLDENLKKMKFLCFPTNKVESILKEFKDNLNYEHKKIKIIEKYDNISICDENGYLIPKETFISEIINSDLEENLFFINKNLFSHFFEIEKEKIDNPKKNKENNSNDKKIRTHRGESNNNRKLKIDDIYNDSKDKRKGNNNNIRKRENYFHTERNEVSGFESLDEFEKKMVKNKKLMNCLNKNKKGNQINFNSKSLNNNYTSAFKDKVNRFAKNNGSIMDTAIKNDYLSFEKLDSLEKNITTFLDKNLNNSKERISLNNNKNEKEKEKEKEKVTINSYYNISNLNNFNDKALFNSLDKIQNESILKKDNSYKKNIDFSKSDKKRKRFISDEGINIEDTDLNENKIENSEIKKTALKNTKHVFNLNLGKIIDGDRLKIEKISENRDKDKKSNKKKYNNVNSDSDLNYSGDSEKAQESKDKIFFERNRKIKKGSASEYFESLESNVKIKNKKSYYNETEETDEGDQVISNNEVSKDLNYKKDQAQIINQHNNSNDINNYLDHNFLCMKNLENSNADSDNHRKASIIGVNNHQLVIDFDNCCFFWLNDSFNC